VCGIAGTILALCAQASLVAQPTAISVPFVRCKSGGQVGPQETPTGTRASAAIDLRAAQKLAYYSASGREDGVLAPRGWYCFGTYGSGGDTVMVSPQPIDTANLFSKKWRGFSGPAIEVSYRYGGTSGRFAVAKVIARVFPAYKAFAAQVMEEGLDAPFEFGPYPKDVLTYKSNRVVEFRTPAQTDGLGTYNSSLKKNSSPIDGVAMLTGETPDLLLLSVRLPTELTGLTSVIVRQVEHDAERRDRR
jgi:hypothetical protein